MPEQVLLGDSGLVTSADNLGRTGALAGAPRRPLTGYGF
jgi:hypothetical protein